jgi:UTP:GlnB (protein PII) uridylyltransferase
VKDKIALMANRNLTERELALAREILSEVRNRLMDLSGDDAALPFAYRRKIAKELQYDERDKPVVRRALKRRKWVAQHKLCAHCAKEMPLKYSHLDRKNAADGYTDENTELVHADCHHERQAAKRYT